MTYIPGGGGGGVSDGDKGDIVVSGSGTSWTFDTAVVTAFAKTVLDDANASAARSTLGVTGTGADAAYAFRANNLSDLASASTARSNLGLVIGTDVLGMGGGTLTGDLSVPDEAYDATNWNGSVEVPTKNAIRDKFESLSSGGGLQIQAAMASDLQATTADNQYVPKHGSAFSGTASSSNNLSVTFTIANAQTVQVHFLALLQKSPGTQRHSIYNSSGTKIWPVHSSADAWKNNVYATPVGEGNGQRVEFCANIALSAGTYTFIVRSEYAVSASNANYYERNLSVLYIP